MKTSQGSKIEDSFDEAAFLIYIDATNDYRLRGGGHYLDPSEIEARKDAFNAGLRYARIKAERIGL